MSGKYKHREDLPKIIRVALPKQAQDIYLDAYNDAWAASIPDGGRELNEARRDEMAHRAGWAAVEQEYVHDEEKGRWYRKSDTLDEEESHGILERLKNLI